MIDWRTASVKPRLLPAFAAILCLALPAAAWAAKPAATLAEDDLLPPDQAFALQATAVDANTVRLNWKVAPGYYLYRDKFKFEARGSGVTLGQAVYPEAEIKEDEFFGKVGIYRGQVSLNLPLQRTPGIEEVSLKLTSQGCADAGVCYPPHVQTANLRLPSPGAAAVPTTAAGGPALDAVKNLGSSLGLSGDGDFLEPDAAFRHEVLVQNAHTLQVRFTIADGYYLYRDKFRFALSGKGVTLGSPQLPPGEMKKDETFGDVAVFHKEVIATLPLQRGSLAASAVVLNSEFQGCAEKGLCYPPIKKSDALDLPPAEAAPTPAQAPSISTPAPAAPTAQGGVTVADPPAPVAEQDALAARLAGGDRLLTLGAFFIAGLLLAFTPCVFPMIPILSGIIAGQGDRITTRRAFVLSVVYVLSASLAFTVAGVLAGLFGGNLQAWFQNPWILTTFALVFVALSLSMFGFYDLQMPASLQGRLTALSNNQEGGTLTGTAVMGLLSALIVGPCVTPPLIGALIYIGNTGDAVLGGLALFSLSLGMGAPLVAIGTGAGQLLPRAGAWMDAVKAVFGVLLLGVAIWLLERILPASVTLLLSSALLIVSAVYMGALEPVPAGASGWRRLWKGLGFVALLQGVLLLLGVAAGGNDLLQPLKGIMAAGSPAASPAAAAHGLAFQRIKGVEGLQRALADAKGKPVMFDFYADWCISCKEMEKYTFSDPAVQAALKDAVLLQADVTPNDALDQALLKHFKLFGPPAILFFDAQGKEIPGTRVVGFKNAADFAAHVRKTLAP
jgi:thiol:disulfide interchange protein DsbD